MRYGAFDDRTILADPFGPRQGLLHNLAVLVDELSRQLGLHAQFTAELPAFAETAASPA